MKLTEILDSMPLLVEARPDFMLDKLTELIRLAAIRIAESGQFLEREYTVPLQCGVGDYLLDGECEENIHKIKRLCVSNTCDAFCPADAQYAITHNGWCSSRSCGTKRFRYLPHNQIQIDEPGQIESGTFLTIHAVVVPKADACELDDLFTSKYKTALYYLAASYALELPGEQQSMSLAKKYEQRAEDELTKAWVTQRSGHANKAPVVRAARFV